MWVWVWLGVAMGVGMGVVMREAVGWVRLGAYFGSLPTNQGPFLSPLQLSYGLSYRVTFPIFFLFQKMKQARKSLLSLYTPHALGIG